MPELSYARQEPMFRDRSLNRSDIATDLAIPLLAEGGWPAMTLAAVAARGNMKRQSVAQWFGNVEAMREQVAWQYTRRWLRLLSAQLTPLYRSHEKGDEPDATTVARLLLPKDDDGIVFARIWLPALHDPEIRALCGLVTGLRAQLCATEPVSLADAQAATESLRRPEALRR